MKPKVWLIWVRNTSGLVTLHAVALDAEIARTMKKVIDTSETVIESRIEERDANHLFNPLFAEAWDRIYGDFLEQAAQAAELKASGDRKRADHLEEELRKVRASAQSAMAEKDAEIERLQSRLLMLIGELDAKRDRLGDSYPYTARDIEDIRDEIETILSLKEDA